MRSKAALRFRGSGSGWRRPDRELRLIPPAVHREGDRYLYLLHNVRFETPSNERIHRRPVEYPVTGRTSYCDRLHSAGRRLHVEDEYAGPGVTRFPGE